MRCGSNSSEFRGTNDWSAPDARQLRDLVADLGTCFASYGYEHIEVPVLEHTDLFRLKSGEDILTKLYAFPYRGRDLCLRPELTASVGRYYVDHCQAAALPQRFAYAGPVFRYERPRQGRYRQFTQAGVELIGPEGTSSRCRAGRAGLAIAGPPWLGRSPPGDRSLRGDGRLAADAGTG